MSYKTKEQKQLYDIEYAKRNAEKKKEYGKKYRELNKQKIKIKNKEYSEKTKEQKRLYDIQYRIKNGEKKKLINKEYYEINKEKIKKQVKKYRSNNRDKINEYHSTRRKNDPLYKLTGNIRGLIKNSFKYNGYKKSSKIQKILGCSFQQFKEHLESQFQPWMSWDNYGLYNGTENYGWDIDHRIPSSSAKTVEELLNLNHFSNLQPLCSYINRDIKKAII